MTTDREFVCRMPEYDPDWSKKVLAWNAKEAAQRFVERFEGDECEYPVASGVSTVKVEIEGEWFEVSGETVPTYNAQKIAAPQDKCLTCDKEAQDGKEYCATCLDALLRDDGSEEVEA